MKIKFFIAALILGALSSNLYGQNNAVFFNIGSPKTPLFSGWDFGVGYERALNKNFSALFTGDIAGMIVGVADVDYDAETALKLEFLAHFRYYPLKSAFDKLFLDLGAGYTFLSLSTGETKISSLLRLQAEIGWKFTMRRMFLQPWLGYNLHFGEITYPKDMSDSAGDLYKYGFVNFGLSLGFIF